MAELHIYPDDRFHVDVYAREGIEAEGHLDIHGNTVSFINEKGSDAVSSDPQPGTYRYSLEGDTLRFQKISDPLDRRARFLSSEWERVAP